MGDNLFILQLQNGNRHALEVFVSENKTRIFRICMAYVQNEEDASDLTQEVFIKAFEKLDSFKGESKLSTWLTRIAINLSLNFLRDNKKRILHEGIDNLVIASDSSEFYNNTQLQKAVRKAIYKLADKQREVFILSFYLDLSNLEICEITSLSISSVESLLFRARKKLREYLEIFYNEIKS